MRPAAQHAVDIGKNFIQAVKAARNDYEAACHVLANKPHPTANDEADYEKLIDEMKLFAKFLHLDIEQASAHFGGTSDMVIRTEMIGHKTMLDKIHKAQGQAKK